MFDFIAFTCRLNWMNYVFKFTFFPHPTFQRHKHHPIFHTNENPMTITFGKVQVRKNKLPHVSFLLKKYFGGCVCVWYWKEEKVERPSVILYSIHSKLVWSCWYMHCAQTNYSVLLCCCVGLCKLTLTRYLIPHTMLFILLKKRHMLAIYNVI